MFIFKTYRYSNLFVTSPSPENLHTLFEFVFKGFDALEYQVKVKMMLEQKDQLVVHSHHGSILAHFCDGRVLIFG